MHFIEMQRKAESLTPQKIEIDFFRFIRSLEKKLAELNRKQLNKESGDVYGEPLGFYSVATDILTDGKKEAGTPFTLFDEGVFLPSIFARVSGRTLLFGANDPKTDEVLKNLLTTDIFGLTDEDLQQVIKTDVVPFMRRYFPRQILR